MQFNFVILTHSNPRDHDVRVNDMILGEKKVLRIID